jgi:hypothetical protein
MLVIQARTVCGMISRTLKKWFGLERAGERGRVYRIEDATEADADNDDGAAE